MPRASGSFPTSRAGTSELADEQVTGLPASETLLDLLSDQVPLAVAVVDASLSLVRWNATFVDIMAAHFGTPSEAITVGASFEQVTPGRERVLRSWFEHALAGEVLTREARAMPRVDGEITYFDFTIAPLVRDGTVVGGVLLASDATARVLATREREEQVTRMQESENELRALFESMTDAVLLLDTDGRFVNVAPTKSRLRSAVDPREYVGRYIRDVFSPKRTEEFMGYIKEVTSTGAPRHVEYRQTLVGEAFWLAATISRVDDEHVLWVARDITGQREQQERARETEDKFTKIFEASGDGIIVTNLLTTKIIEANPACCRMHGYTREEFLELPPAGPGGFIHPDSWPIFEEFVAEILAGNEYRARARDIRKDGSIIDIEVTGVPFNYHGEPHVIAMVRDITEQVRSIELLEQRVKDRTNELATLLDVSRRVTSRIELASLLRVILDQVRLVVPYEGAAMSMVDGDDIVIFESRGQGGQVRETEAEGMRLRGALLGDIGERIRRGEAVGSPNVRAGDDEYAHAFRRLVGPAMYTDAFRYIVSQAMIPLMARGRLVGVMTVSRNTPEAFSEHDIELALTFAGHAGAALDNARLLSDSERRAEQLSTLLEMARITASTVDVDQLFSVVTEQLKRVVDYSAVAVCVRDGDGFRLWNRVGPTNDELKDGQERGVILPAPPGMIAQLEAGEPISTLDVRGNDPVAQFFRELTGPHFTPVFDHVRAWVAAPLLIGGELAGYLSVTNIAPNAFTKDDALLISAFANQVSVAMENADLFAQVQERTHELGILLDVSRAAASTMNLDEMVDTLIDQLKRVVDYSTARVNMREGDEFRLLARRGPARDDLGDFRTWHVDAPPEMVDRLATGEVVIAPDITQDTPESGFYRSLAGPLLASAGHVGTWLAAPLQGRTKLLGFVTLTKPEAGSLSQKDAQLVAAFASQVGVALENAALFREVEQRALEITALYRADAELHRSLALDDVLQSLVNVASEVMQCESSVLAIRDPRDGRLHIRAWYGITDEVIEPLNDRFGMFPILASEQGEIMVYEDMSSFPGLDTRITELTGVRSFVGVPVQSGAVGFGVFFAGFQQVHNFGVQEIRQYRAIAERAGMAIQNARLFEEAQRRARETEALARVAASINFERPLRDALDDIAAVVCQATNAVACDVTLVENGRLQQSGQYGLIDGLGVAMQSLEPGGVSPVFQALKQQHPLVLEHARSNLLKTPDYALVHGLIEKSEWEGILVIPMTSRGFALGTLGVYYRDGEMPGAEEQAFLRAITAQAAIAVDNARLFAEAQRRARANAALARVASSLMYNRPVQEVVDSLAEDALAGTQARSCAVTFMDNDAADLAIVGSAGLPAGYAAGMVESWRIGGVPAMRDAFTNRGIAIVPHAKERLLSDPTLAPLRHLVDVIEFDCVVTLPLYYRERPNGAITFYYRTETDLDDEEREYVAALAGQVAVALENVRLFMQTEQRAREMEALYKADHEIFQSLDLDTVLKALMDVSVDFLQADKGLVLMWEPDQGRFVLRASHGVGDATLSLVTEEIAAVPLDAIGEVYILRDTALEQSPIGRLLAAEGVVTGIRLPVRAGDRLFGSFALAYTSPHEFTAEELRVLTALTDRAGVAITNADLYTRSQQVASLEERQRLARELHDSVSQALFGIALGAKTARTLLDRDPAKATEPMDYVLQLAEAGLAEMRALIFELRPESLETEGLVAAIDKQVAATRSRYGIAVDAQYCPEPDLPLAVKEAFFRIGQEALHNTVKHARATAVTVRLDTTPATISLTISDNGIGFDPSGEFPGHLGLRSMRERIERFGGQLEVTSTPGKGASIRASLPIRQV